MPRQALFAGLIIDEYDRPLGTAYVGDEPCYVIDDAGFHRHIPAETIDRQILQTMTGQMRGNEELVAKQAAKMLGQDDIFSLAMLENQLKNIEQQLDQVMQAGIPEEGRAYLGMLGFRVRVNYHGEIIAIEQPGAIDSDEE
jgi:hypothetical protein